MLIGAPGLERPVAPTDTFMPSGQAKAAMPDPADAGVDKESIASHIAEAQARAHPLADAVEARPDLQSAIEWLVGYDSTGHLDKERTKRLAFLDEAVRSLKPVDERLRSMRTRSARKLLRSTYGRKPSIAIWAALIRAMEWPDTTVVEGIICGFPTVGHYPETGVFRQCERPALQAFEGLRHDEHNRRLGETLGRLAASESPRIQAAIEATHRLTRKEVDQGLMRGPFFTAAEVENDLRVEPSSWRALHRFAIKQGTRPDGSDKWRCCDNGRSSGTNDCLYSRETITCERASFPAVVGRIVANTWPPGAPLPKMRIGTDDISAAYRRLPCAHPETTVVAVWDPERGAVAYYTMDGHNFGLSAAVLSFNRVSQLIATVARRFFGVAVAAYFDDFCVVEPEFAGATGKRAIRALSQLLGMEFSREKDVRMAVANPFLGVIADFSSYSTEGAVVLRPKPTRVSNLVASLETALADGFLPAAQADALAGKLDFVSLSSGAYRVGRTAIRALRTFRDSLRKGGLGGSVTSPGLPEYLQEAMRFLIAILPRLPPAVYMMRKAAVPPIVVYTDAAFEPDDPRPAGLGACVYDPLAPGGHQWVVLSEQTSPEVIARWKARRQYIGQLEALAVVATYYTLADGAPLPKGGWSHVIRGRDVIHYVDNYGAMACLVKGDSRDPDIGRLAHLLSAILVSIRARPWLDYVRSASNVSDLPSRFDIEGLLEFIPPFRHYGFKALRFWDTMGCSYASILRELGGRQGRTGRGDDLPTGPPYA